jgi:type IV pilus assembly protein PilF
MRHESIVRWTAWALLAACVAGCGSTSGTKSSRDAGDGISPTGQANVRLAQTYLQTDKLELAMDRATRALRSDPDSADAHVVMGLILERLDESARAGEHYMRAAKLAPGEGFVLNAAGVWQCEHGHPAEADALFARAIEDLIYPQRSQVFFNAGKCAADAGDLAKAEAYLRGGLNIAPDDKRLLEQMVRLKVRQNDLMGARAFFQRREALGPPGPEMLALAVRIEQGAGDAAAAERYRRQLQAQHPGYTPAAADGSQP